MFIAFTLLLLALFSHAQEEQLPPWSYSHPEKWPGKYCVSNDNRQSPISFRDVSMQPRESRALRVNGNCTLGRGTKAIMDLGHRQISAGDTALNGCFVVHPMSNKEQAGVFKVDRIHLHTRGEHAIGASVEDAEMHIVMSSVVNASNKMVLGVLIREAKGEQQADARLEHTLRGFLAQASREGTAWDYSAGLRELLPGSARQGRALLYDGSLTTPTCDPVVSWVVFETPARVSAGLIQSLRQLQLNRTGERFNNRPLQNATGRKVTPVELIEATAHVKKAPAVHNHTLPPKASSRTMAPIHGLVDTAASPSVGVLSGNTFIILLIIVSVVVAWKFVRSARASDVAAGVAPPTAAPRRNYGSV